MTVEEVMTRTVVAMEEEQTLREAIELLQRHRIRQVPVVRGEKVVGIITDRDVKRATPSLLSGVVQEEFYRVLNETTVSQVMTRNPFTVTPSMQLKDAVKIMVDRKFGALPVVQSDRLVGIISEIDMLRAFHETLQE